ncbi:hypothetical protein Q9Q99_07635 [Curtobacterium flaccumfaciens]|nr:hypothetical protein Q9Q99_07635 [Curtobacterium flaccumfaciens]
MSAVGERQRELVRLEETCRGGRDGEWQDRCLLGGQGIRNRGRHTVEQQDQVLEGPLGSTVPVLLLPRGVPDDPVAHAGSARRPGRSRRPCRRRPSRGPRGTAASGTPGAGRARRRRRPG